jgi:hypothetical protein
MKKRKKSLRKGLGQVILHLDDIEKIISVFKKIPKIDHDQSNSTIPELIITAGDYEIDDPSELRNLSEKHIDRINFEYSDKEHYFKIDINKNLGADVYSSKDTLLDRGVFNQLVKILESQRIKITIIKDTISKLAMFLLLPYFIILLIAISTGDRYIYLVSFTILAVSLILMGVYIGSTFYKSRITLEYEQIQQSFWARNSDKIWLSVISIIIGGLMTLLIQFLVGLFR